LTTNQAPDKQQRLYLTEDTAVVSMKFNDALMGNVIAARRGDAGPGTTTLRVHGKDALLTVTETRVTLGTDGTTDEQAWDYAESEQDVMVRLLSDFAQSIHSPKTPTALSSAAENLANMAVFESAYLSARTGFPEEPARILRITRNPSGTATSI
jgi:predicted dehydrogenase